MSTGLGYVFSQGVLGAFMGGAKGLQADAENEMKQEAERVKEERMSKLRMGEYAQKQAMDTAAEKTKQGERAAFYDRTDKEAQAKFSTQTTNSSEPVVADEASGGVGAGASGIIDMGRSATRQEVSGHRLEQAKKSGDAELLKQAYAEDKDIRSETEQERKAKADETRAAAAEHLAGLKELEIAVKEKNAETRARQVDAAIAKALGGGADKDPAKVREVKWLADSVFNGDLEKATSFAYGTQDKPRTEAVMRMAHLLKGSDADTGKPDDLMRKAEEMVDRLRGKEGATRGGVSISPPEPTVAAPSDAAKPKTQAEFNAIPRGARYVNPSDGKIYIKK